MTDVFQIIHESTQASNEIRTLIPGASESIKQAMGYFITDPIKRMRQRANLETVRDIVQEKISDRDMINDVSETETRPIIEAASDDDRAEFQNIWANLLAKFATGNANGFRREFVQTLKNLEPLDVKCLQILPNIIRGGSIGKEVIISVLYDELGKTIEKNEIDISLDNLKDNKCFIFRSENQEYGGWELSSYGSMLSRVALTPF